MVKETSGAGVSALVRATMSTRPLRSSGSPPVNRTAVMPSRSTPDGDQPDHLVVGEDLLVREPVQTLGRHAVGATQVAAVDQRHPEIGCHPAVPVGENVRRHPEESSQAPVVARPPAVAGRPATADDQTADTLRRVRFLLSRRWLLFAVTVAAMAWGASLLGQWQFHRLDERRAREPAGRANLARPPVPLDDLLAVDRPVPERAEWRKVVAHGTWDDAHTIVLKYQTRDGASGVDVVTPLRTEGGAAVLVDRGWMASPNVGVHASRPAADDPRRGHGDRLDQAGRHRWRQPGQ